eukprot:maker-scaffold143_size313727-snap-gene-1.22 protein:Tk09409 transcript:maker-scaffold143_size313727-snap-gene-1.22-mRNA-1 annotation:"PREDICTED: uncharacterized protein LOC100142575"
MDLGPLWMGRVVALSFILLGQTDWQATSSSIVRFTHRSGNRLMTLDSSKRTLPRRKSRFKRWSYPFGTSSIHVSDGSNPKTRDELLHEILDNQHPIIENQDMDVADFLWTGDGAFDGDYDYSESEIEINTINHVDGFTFTVTKTIVSSVVPTQSHPQASDLPTFPGDMDTSASAFNPQYISPTPVQTDPKAPSSSSMHGDPQMYEPLDSSDLPEEQFLIRTILQSNMTMIHKGIENFKRDMERKLTRAYRSAYEAKRFKREMSTTLEPREDSTDAADTTSLVSQEETTTAEIGLDDTTNILETTPLDLIEFTDATTLIPDTSTLALESIEALEPETETTTEAVEDSTEPDPTTPGPTLEQARNLKHPQWASLANDDDEESYPVVKIHNIRSSLPRPEIEVIYTVNRDGDLIPAVSAVEALCNVEDDEVASVLGFPLVTKAEPYTVRAEPYIQSSASSTSWLIAAVIVSTCLALIILLALLLLLHRFKKEENNHKRLLPSPGPSAGTPDEHSHTGIHVTMGPSSPLESIDQAAFTLAGPKGGRDVASGPSPANSTLQVTEGGKFSSGEDIFRSRGNLDDSKEGESPALADLSSNNTPEMPPKTKTRKTSRERKHSRSGKKGKSPHSPEGIDQSVFPVRTPDKEGFLGPLTDLLEEEIMLPGESRETSARAGSRNWAYLPQNRMSPTASSTSSTSSGDLHPHKDSSPLSSKPWHQRKRHKHKQPSPSPSNSACSEQLQILGEPSVASRKLSSCTKEEEVQHFQGLGEGATALASDLPLPDSPDLKKRALSAKSHITRKGKIQSSTDKIAKNQTRPWSATESRLQADPVFHMRQRHWEGLIAGKKSLHRGQLLPGSTSEEEVQYQLELRKRRQPQACWSEGTSPKKQVSFSTDPPAMKESTPDASDESKDDNSVPIIQAIKDELQKFQRPKSPNLTGITIINDPNLLYKESDA